MNLKNLDQTDLAQLPFSIIDFIFKNNIVQSQNSRVFIQSGHNHHSVNINEIICGKADGHYTVFVLACGKEIMASQGIKFYEDTLRKRGFFKANRSCILNIDHISSIYKKEPIFLSNNDKIHIPVRNKAALSELLESLM
jgi:two-component system LytT family response regulator